MFKHSFAIKATSRSALIYSFQCSSSSDKGDCEKAIKTKYDSYKLDIDDYIFLKIDMHYAMVIKAFKQEYTAS